MKKILLILIPIAIFGIDYASTWKTSCEISNFSIEFESDNKAKIEVNSNQIYLTAKVVEEKNKISFFLISPNDLGRGGMMLDWKNFSKNTPIMSMRKINNNVSNIEWFGFYNLKRNQYEWKEDSDLVLEGLKAKQKNEYEVYSCGSNILKSSPYIFATFASNPYTIEFNKHGAVLKESQKPDKIEWLYLGNKCDAFSKVHGKGTWKFDNYEKGTFTIRFDDKTTFPFDNLSDRFWKNNLPNQAQECK